MKRRTSRGVRIFVLLLTFSSVFAIAQTSVQASVGKPVMVDGRLSPGEWSDAAKLELAADFGTVYVKRSGEFVYIALELADQNQLSTVDMYLSSPDGAIYDLHASAKLGERLFKNGWSEWTWWNNDRWTANWARIDTFEPRRFLNEPNHEFQIVRARFPGKEWKLMFEIMTHVHPGGGDTKTFPAGARNSDPSNWYRIRLE